MNGTGQSVVGVKFAWMHCGPTPCESRQTGDDSGKRRESMLVFELPNAGQVISPGPHPIDDAGPTDWKGPVPFDN